MKKKTTQKTNKVKGWTAAQKRQLKELIIKHMGPHKDWAKNHLVIL